MATTRHVYYAIECDNCGVSPVRVMGDEVEAARYAKRFGWQVAVDGDDPGSDLCPSCVDLESEAS